MNWIGPFCLDERSINIFLVLKYQTSEANSRWHVVGCRPRSREQEGFSCCLISDGAWPDGCVKSNQILNASIIGDRHDQSLREIPLPGAPLLVFLTSRYSVLGGTRLVKRAITVGTQDL